jgi:hypothetical protein
MGREMGEELERHDALLGRVSVDAGVRRAESLKTAGELPI